jgi:hypothetical protein
MTAQIPDKVIYQNDEYIIAGVKGLGLVTPDQFGITPTLQWLSSANWRGFYTTYTLENGTLYLTEMGVGSDNYPPIQGILPIQLEEYDPPAYRGLKLPTPFEGFLLIARDLTKEISAQLGFEYANAGFRHYFEYQTVFEMQFEAGKLRQVADHSGKMSALRSQLTVIIEERAKTIEPLQKQYDKLHKEQITIAVTPSNDGWQTDPTYIALGEQVDVLWQQMNTINDSYSAKAERTLQHLLLDYDEL